jgi:hypothetical protein
MRLSDQASQVLTSIQPYLVESKETNEYPGGVLPWGTVQVNRYRLDNQLLKIVVSATDHLFEWQEPLLPNDLCLLMGREPWLITMASDRVALLNLDREEVLEVQETIPSLRIDALGKPT